MFNGKDYGDLFGKSNCFNILCRKPNFWNAILFTALRRLQSDKDVTLDELLEAAEAQYRAEDQAAAKAKVVAKAKVAKASSKQQEHQEKAKTAGRTYRL